MLTNNIKIYHYFRVCLVSTESGSPHEPCQRVTVSDCYELTRNQSKETLPSAFSVSLRIFLELGKDDLSQNPLQ